jgi:acyl carrier protein
MQMDENAIRADVRKLIAQLAPVQGVEISPSRELTVDLGYDSLRLMELATHFEDRFGLEDIGEDDAAEVETVGEVEALVLRLVAETQAQPS